MHNLILVFCLERPFTIIVIKPLQDDKYFKYERMWIQPKDIIRNQVNNYKNIHININRNTKCVYHNCRLFTRFDYTWITRLDATSGAGIVHPSRVPKYIPGLGLWFVLFFNFLCSLFVNFVCPCLFSFLPLKKNVFSSFIAFDHVLVPKDFAKIINHC